MTYYYTRSENADLVMDQILQDRMRYFKLARSFCCEFGIANNVTIFCD